MKKILINYAQWQTRVAITRDDVLQNIYFETRKNQVLERSFFKGIITKILPGIQTAFVDIGQEKAGFLHISEIDRELAIQKIQAGIQMEDLSDEDAAPAPVKEPRRQQLDISKILKEGDPILVQVSKEPIYEKGAKLTTCFTLPGRFLVLMPNIPRIGISKKIESSEERQRLKAIIKAHIPQGMGVIIRTTSEEKTEKEIVKDLTYLLSTWDQIAQKFKAAEPKERLYDDLCIALQAVRDHLDDDVESVITDNNDNLNLIYKFVKNIAPEQAGKIKLYKDSTPLFIKYKIENQIEEALQKKVQLKSGGSIVIESTEAMTVVDVNTGKFTGSGNLEETILRTNLEAAEEIVRQLRLRNIGGLIVIDFIDMATSHSRQKLFKFFEKTLKERDKFQSVVLKISEFGLVQMTRKRSGKTLVGQLTEECSKCHGNGHIKSLKTQSYEILNRLNNELETNRVKGDVKVTLPEPIFKYLNDHEYDSILFLEKKYGCKITLVSKETQEKNS